MLPTDNAARKALPAWSFLINYFPDAFLEVVKVAVAGNNQHNPGEELHWAREKSTDQMNTAFRHMMDHGRGTVKDTDECYHLAKSIWRLSAELQLQIEKDRLRERAHPYTIEQRIIEEMDAQRLAYQGQQNAHIYR
jgi:Domain of unknown function (DUF5664)